MSILMFTIAVLLACMAFSSPHDGGLPLVRPPPPIQVDVFSFAVVMYELFHRNMLLYSVAMAGRWVAGWVVGAPGH